MRIGFMLRNLKDLGGIKVYTINLLENLLKIDQKNEYILLYQDRDLLGTYSHYPRVREIHAPMPTRFLWDQVAVPWIARREKIDLIFNPKLSIPLWSGAKTVFPLHGVEQFAVRKVFPLLDRMYFQLMMPIFCRYASAIISMTDMGVSEMNKYLHVETSKIHPIHEAYHERFKVLSREELSPIRQKYQLPEKYLLFVGGLNPLKNFSNILRAFHQLKKISPHKLIVVGFKRWKFEKDLALVKKLGLENDVIFTGFIPDEDLPHFYNMAECFVFPSLYEGFGIPILEAMACGCPVVTTKTGCSPEVAGEAAVFVDPQSPDEIAGAIQKVLSDPLLKDRLIEKGLARSKQFSWEKTARQTLMLMEKLVV